MRRIRLKRSIPLSRQNDRANCVNRVNRVNRVIVSIMSTLADVDDVDDVDSGVDCVGRVSRYDCPHRVDRAHRVDRVRSASWSAF